MKPRCLKSGDKVAIVSLSSGVLGESFVKHEIDLAEARLREYGLQPVYMKNSLKGIDFLANKPQARAQDLIDAFEDNGIKAIICAIGGNDTYKLAPYLMENEAFINAVKNNPKIFTGFSDTTINHLMLNRLGLNTFYGPNYLCDLAELDTDMLPYTKAWFELYMGKLQEQIVSSDVWYNERSDFSPNAVGTSRISNKETKGFEVLQGSGIKEGKLFGGCIDSLHELVFGDIEKTQINNKYKLFPSKEELNGKILFLETSDSKMQPQKLEQVLNDFAKIGVFDAASAIIVGKPQDEVFYEEYKDVFKKVLGAVDLPILYNVNFGHAVPRCVIPYNINTQIDFDKKTITFLEPIFEQDTVANNTKRENMKELVKALVDKYTDLSKDNAFVWIGDVIIYYDKEGKRVDDKIGFYDYECINYLFDLKSQEYIDIYQKNLHTIVEKAEKKDK